MRQSWRHASPPFPPPVGDSGSVADGGLPLGCGFCRSLPEAAEVVAVSSLSAMPVKELAVMVSRVRGSYSCQVMGLALILVPSLRDLSGEESVVLSAFALFQRSTRLQLQRNWCHAPTSFLCSVSDDGLEGESGLRLGCGFCPTCSEFAEVSC